MLVSRCPSCNRFLVLPQRSCPTDPERRCVDIVASAASEAHHRSPGETRAAQTVYSSITAIDIVHTACALEPFLQTVLDGASRASSQGKTAAPRRRPRTSWRVADGRPDLHGPHHPRAHHTRPLDPDAESRRPLATGHRDGRSARRRPLGLSSGRPEFLQETAVDILEYWWGPYGRNAWRSKISHNR